MTDTKLVSQPTAAPTRKMTAATLAGGLMAAIQWLVTNLAPQYAGWLQDPVFVSIETAVVMFVAGYFTKNAET